MTSVIKVAQMRIQKSFRKRGEWNGMTTKLRGSLPLDLF